ncbi:MAG: hypothetical protein Fur0022_13420 [Anaerolineales bacterium]
MVRTQIQLTEEQSLSLKMLAEKEKMSIAELIRQSVDQFLRTHQGASLSERRQRSLEVVGKYRSGLPDIGTNHDKYLAEAFES